MKDIYYNELYPSYACAVCGARKDQYCNECKKSIGNGSYYALLIHSYSQHDKIHHAHVSFDARARVYFGLYGLTGMSFLVNHNSSFVASQQRKGLPDASNSFKYPSLFVEAEGIRRLNEQLLLLDFDSVSKERHFYDDDIKKMMSQVHGGFTIPGSSGNLIVCVDDDVTSILEKYILGREYVCLFCRMEYEKGMPAANVVYNHVAKCRKHPAKCADAISMLGSPQS